MVSKSLANIGDLIFCHAIGSKYGWYLNQIAIVVSCVQNPLKEDPSNYEFKLYVFSYRDYQLIQSKDFEKGNVEIISKESGGRINIDRIKELSRISRLKSFAENV